VKSPFLGLGSEEALRHVADALADGLFTTDADGRVTFWNDGAERITGWTRGEAIGTNCSILAGDAVSGCSCGRGPIRCGLAAKGRSSKQCTIRTKDGRLLAIVKSAVPIRDAKGSRSARSSRSRSSARGRRPRRCGGNRTVAARSLGISRVTLWKRMKRHGM
jgi:PAS domain S-box-containing protein